ncbi:MAG TPA: DUF4214 domain-containing protein, partial [Pirellulales bacterium]|nr:DUF4214 domain-containing protein [Pirellulales bacterium]
ISLDSTTHAFTVSGQHSYAQSGTFSIQVTLNHETSPAVTVAGTADVANATTTGATGLAASAVSVTGYEFSTLTGVTVATFADGDPGAPGPASDFSATIDWGDGSTSAGSITLSSGAYAVSGRHEYFDEGHYTVQVGIDQTAGPASGTTSATVSATANIHEQLLEDGTVGTPDQKYIQEIYRDVFGRQAEPGGLQFWVNDLTQGTSRSDVAYQMVKLAFPEEFQHDTVESLYEHYLGRAADAMGLQYWSAYLYDGGTIEGMSQALLGSQEYYQARGGGTDSGFVSALFEDALGRAINSGDLAYFEGLMGNGMSPSDIAALVLNSDEYHRLRVDSLFEQFLDRPADLDALAFFAGELEGGETDEMVISQLISSDEYYDRAQT